MSFYDSASLAFLPSGGAGKDGKAYSIKPVPEYGNELVTNGGFDTDSYWTKETGWSIANGKATQDGSAVGTGGEGDLVSGGTIFQIGKTYLIKIDIVDYVSGDLKVTSSNIPLSANKDGSYYTYYTAATAYLHIRAGYSSFIGSIDNVSVKEVIVDGDFDFSRGSNLTATRVDSNGLIEKGRENLLLQSNQFDTSWTLNSTSVTSGQSGYDGTNDAWLLNSTTTGFPRIEQLVSVSGINTYSVYLKPATDGFINMRIFGADAAVWFNANDGLIANASGSQYVSSNIQSVGNGWYRCSVIVNGSITSVRIYPASSYGTYSTSGNGVYIQDAQLEAGLVATEYIESGASKGKAGILEDSPRFDYSGGASCPSLLLEPSRTNLIPSEYLPLMSIIGSPVITPNTTTSPEGYQNMAEFSSSATSDRYQKNLGVLSGQHTFSAFFKYSGTDKSVYLRMSDTSSRLKVDIASSGVTIDSGGSSNIDDSDVIDYGNGIYRAYMVFTPSTGTTLAQFYPSATDTSGSIYAYGFQMEEGSYPTSYIPNHSGGSVTRNAENCSGAGNSSTFNDTEGVLYAEIAYIADDQVSKVISLSDGTFDERVLITARNGASNEIRVFIKSGGSFSATIDATLTDITDFNKIAYRYKSGETKLFINGSLISTSTDTFSISGLNALQFASGTSTASPFYGNAKQVIVFNTALSDTDCEILTGTSYESFAAMATALNYTTYE